MGMFVGCSRHHPIPMGTGLAPPSHASMTWDTDVEPMSDGMSNEPCGEVWFARKHSPHLERPILWWLVGLTRPGTNDGCSQAAIFHQTSIGDWAAFLSDRRLG